MITISHKRYHLRELLTPVIRKGRVRVLGRVRTAPRGHDCPDNADCADPEMSSKSLESKRIFNVFAKLASPKQSYQWKTLGIKRFFAMLASSKHSNE